MDLQWIWAAAPGWPTPAPGWTPPDGWHAASAWPVAPPNWVFWRYREKPWDLFDLDADSAEGAVPEQPGPARWVAPIGWPNLDTAPSRAERETGRWPEPPTRWNSWRTSDGAPADATFKQASKAQKSRAEKTRAIQVHGPRAMATAIRNALDKIRLLAEPIGPENELELKVLREQLRRGEGSARAALAELAPLAAVFDEGPTDWHPELSVRFWTFYFEIEETLQELVDGQIEPIQRLFNDFERTRNPATMKVLGDLMEKAKARLEAVHS